MKKKHLKNLSLNKKSISDLSSVFSIIGGNSEYRCEESVNHVCPNNTQDINCPTNPKSPCPVDDSFDNPCNPNTNIGNGASCYCPGL